MKYTSFNKNVVVALTALLICLSQVLSASNRTSIAGIPQNDTISAAWEELTSGDFVKAVKLSQGVCIIPMGVIEKHGQQLPLGTDVYTARELALRAATMEYAVVFPFYYAGQIYEAKHQPGTIAYSPQMLYNLLDETCREISRNGFKKIIIVNGHGGNNNFLHYFCQTQLAQENDYSVFLYTPQMDKEVQDKINSLRSNTIGGHADEVETGVMMYIRPDLVKKERASLESGADMNRLTLPNGYTGIWWYGKYPNHYAGDALGASAAMGELSVTFRSEQLSRLVKAVKKDKSTEELQRAFYKEAANPLDTKAR
ncbi:MAG: creatininase family protein [Bacteroidia bacterium]|nr:creatininase family protein [Bacteroidia bacterium]